MGLAQADAQTEQQVEVPIHDYAFIASHAPLLLNTTAVVAFRHSGVGLLSVRTSSGQRCLRATLKSVR